MSAAVVVVTTKLRPHLLLLALVFACDAPSEAEGAGAVPDACDLAQEHLSECFGEPVVLEANCDSQEAELVTEQSCAALMDSKSDGNGLLCHLGLLRFCPEPVCETEVSEAPQTCADLIGQPGCSSCEFYACKDSERAEPCGENGYDLDYGYRYCNRFSQQVRPRLSRRGQVWIDGTRDCLQSVLDDTSYDDLSCDEVRRQAYDSHPPCYAQGGFCELPLSDILLVLNTVAPADFELRQALVTGLLCLRDLFDPASLELTEDGVDRLITAGVMASGPASDAHMR